MHVWEMLSLAAEYRFSTDKDTLNSNQKRKSVKSKEHTAKGQKIRREEILFVDTEINDWTPKTNTEKKQGEGKKKKKS